MIKIYLTILCASILQTTLVSAQCTTNFLTNPSFENPIQPSLGNNFPAPFNTFNGWIIPTATAGTQNGGFNVIKVNGSAYSGGPDVARGAGNQYVDINNAGGSVRQNFTLSCPATITFSGWFSRRESGGTGFSSNINILNGATVVATSSVVNFTATESQEVWKQVTGTANLAAGTYTFSFVMDDFTNVDDAFLCASPGCVLPITIADFSGVSEKCIDNLSWQTTSEINSSRFDIENSNDGITFKTVKTIPTKNISTGSNYTFSCKTSGNTKTFYRLKGVDVDGKLSYSKIINVASNCDAVSINVYPNPVADILHVNLSGNNLFRLVVFNTEGKMVVPFTILKNGDNTVNMKNLSKAVYIVKVFGELETKVFRVTKK